MANKKIITSKNSANTEIYELAKWADLEIVANQKQKGDWRKRNYKEQEIFADLREHIDKLEAAIINKDKRAKEYLADTFCYLMFLGKNTLSL